MLMSFSVDNFRSICKEQKLSFVSDKATELENNACSITNNNKIRLLKSCVIYGANASGKSNLLKALATMKNIITSNREVNSELPVVPFLLDPATKNAPSLFEVNISIAGDRFQYGFSCTKEKIINEWLYVYPHLTGKRRTWFERLYDQGSKNYDWNVTNNIKGTKTVWVETTRENVLFLSNAVSLNCVSLKPLFDFFSTGIAIVLSTDFIPLTFTTDMALHNNKEEILNFLKAADLKITDFKIKKEKVDYQNIKGLLPEQIRESIEKNPDSLMSMNIKTIHSNKIGNQIEFDLERDESDGTKKLFKFTGPFIDVLKKGRVLVVDDLNISLHPFLMKFLVELFHNENTNPKCAQLLVTTHETSIMTQDIFRRDQIWFTKLNSCQMTELFPLTDFKPLKGSSKERLEVKYFKGKYGALPYIDVFSLNKF